MVVLFLCPCERSVAGLRGVVSRSTALGLPQTAGLGEDLTIKPAMTGDIGSNDMVNARNTQGLTAVLGQACAAEAGNGGFPNFPQFLLQ